MRSGAEILTKCSLFILTILIITLGIAATTSQQPDTMGKKSNWNCAGVVFNEYCWLYSPINFSYKVKEQNWSFDVWSKVTDCDQVIAENYFITN